MSRETVYTWIAYLPLMLLAGAVGICTEQDWPMGWVPWVVIGCAAIWAAAILVRDRERP